MAKKPKKNAVVTTPAVTWENYEFKDDDFKLRGSAVDTKTDSNFASQSYWKDVRVRFFAKKSAVVSLILIVIFALLAIFRLSMAVHWKSRRCNRAQADRY